MVLRIPDFDAARLRTLNSATQYPSIPTYHALGERGNLARVGPGVTLAGPEFATSAGPRWFSFKYRVTRASGLTRLRAKLWVQGGTEPSWQADCWTTAAVTADSGSFMLMRSGSGSAYYDDLRVTSVGGTLDPIPPP